ncbi:putative serine hydrolase [Starmerella bacillaris]|mgnify:FL=1|uniref:Serine hydrolase n=1 Tax=Starmerella bacillaris TaxID=1247836 RepID=A0AAV5RGG4_STABA|nr:putative serine hydrolase [Starmerella bacillaris]
MKFLCLHGYTQNASLFAKKASGLRKLLKKNGHELVFIDGPVKIEPKDLPFEPSQELLDTDMRGWFCIDSNDPETYGNTARAFEAVKAAVEAEGPFDGLIGFSQGAGLAAILTKALPQIAPSNPALKIAILYSAFRLEAPSAQHWYETPFTTPTLHVMGTLDTVVPEERGMILYNCWAPNARQVLKHPGGHYTPSQKPILQAVLAFVNDVIEGKYGGDAEADANAETEAKPEQGKGKEDWSEFDNIGKN